MRNGLVRPEAAYSHPQRNVILRSLGHQDEVEVDVFQEVLAPGDVLMLCSDGLWGMLRDEKEIVRMIEQHCSLSDACRELVRAANEAGGEDNISAVLARVED